MLIIPSFVRNVVNTHVEKMSESFIREKPYLVIAHAALCLGSLMVSHVWFPPHELLYNWWFAPLDAVALVLITGLLAVAATCRLGFVFGANIVLIEAVALLFLVVQNPDILTKVVTLMPLLIGRGIIAWRLTKTAPAVVAVRRCE